MEIYVGLVSEPAKVKVNHSVISVKCLVPREKCDNDLKKEDVVEKLRSAMNSHPDHDSGYLSADDIVQLTLSYLTVYNVVVGDTGHIRHCVNIARSHSIHRGMVSVEIFLQYL